MAKGGYKILDLKGNDFTINGDGITIAGIYDAIENSYGKALMIENYLIGGVEKNARYCTFGVDDGDYISTVGLNSDLTKALYIKVKDDDKVSFYDV